MTSSEAYTRFDAADYLENLDDASAVPHGLGIVTRSLGHERARPPLFNS